MQRRVPYLVVGMSSLLLSGLAGAQGYQWTEIVIPGATVFQAFGLNDKGQTTVITSVGSGIYGDGTFTPLPPLAGFQVGAIGINNDGVITGRAFTVAGQDDQGFILHKSTYRLFSRKGWNNTDPRAIANSGLITGQSYSGSMNAGFIYDPDTDTFTDATPPGSTNTITEGMNAFGRITGHGVELPGIGRYGFVWQQQTITNGKRELPPFLSRVQIDAGVTSARGINDSGVVVGFTSNAAGTNDGFVGSDALGYQRLVAPGGEIAGNSTFCSGINNLARVVCYVWDSASNPQGAFIGTPVEGEDNVDSSSRPTSTRDIAASSGAAEWTNKPSEELVIPTTRHSWPLP